MGLKNFNHYVQHKMQQEVSRSMGKFYHIPYAFTLMIGLPYGLMGLDIVSTLGRIGIVEMEIPFLVVLGSALLVTFHPFVSLILRYAAAFCVPRDTILGELSVNLYGGMLAVVYAPLAMLIVVAGLGGPPVAAIVVGIYLCFFWYAMRD